MTTLELHRHLQVGPALNAGRLPVRSVGFSIGCHIALVVAIAFGVHTVARAPSRTIMVNLLPAVAALGTPDAEPSASPDLRPRPEAPAPRPPSPAPKALPTRADVPPPPRPLPVRDLPSRDLPKDALPDPSLMPQRTVTAAMPRTDPKDLAALASVTPSTANVPLPAPPLLTKSVPQSIATTAPAAREGRPDGSPRGAGSVTLEVDFPYAWYLAVIQRKISERWQDKALPGHQPTVIFEIGRDGRVNASRVTIEKSSGNTLYDRAAMRAIEEATPFPPLPADFNEALLRIHLGFAHSRDRG